ncbi:MAG: heavy metal-associated domain-containing protein, partial [Spirosomataceae bacterium]
MKHTYQITGMTCNGCFNHVQKTLDGVPGVTKAEVNLEEKSASIVIEKHIPLQVFKTALQNDGGKYQIGMLNEAMEEIPKEKHISKPDNNGKFYCPMHCE